MKTNSQPLTDQHLMLRLLILLMALVGNLGASFRMLLMQIALFGLFSLLDLTSLKNLRRALRLIIIFLAAYWLFATILNTPFLSMTLFSLKLIFFAQVTVYTFSHLSMPRVLHDCRWLLKRSWGRGLVFYLAATVMFVNSLRSEFLSPRRKDVPATQRFVDASKASLEQGDHISQNLEAMMADPTLYQDATPAPALIGLALLTLMTFLGAI